MSIVFIYVSGLYYIVTNWLLLSAVNYLYKLWIVYAKSDFSYAI